MPGTVTIAARPRVLGGERLRVRADGAVVGKVLQGGCFELTLEDGDHVFRLSAGGFRSRNISLRISEGVRLHLDGGQRGWFRGLLPISGVAIGAAWFGHDWLLALVFALIAVGAYAVSGTSVWLRVAPPVTAPFLESVIPDKQLAEL
jgi:hypothetical protein